MLYILHNEGWWKKILLENIYKYFTYVFVFVLKYFFRQVFKYVL